MDDGKPVNERGEYISEEAGNVVEEVEEILDPGDPAALDAFVVEEIKKRCGRSIVRSGKLIELHKYLSAETVWLTAPCSTRFHNAFAGGLILHSLKVLELMFEHHHLLHKARCPIDPVQLTLVGLFHDIGKVGAPGEAYYEGNVGKKGKVLKTAYKVNHKTLSAIPVPMRSVILASKFIDLSEDESHAIFYHDGLYSYSYRDTQSYERPLTLFLHMMDNWSAKFCEPEETEDDTQGDTSKSS